MLILQAEISFDKKDENSDGLDHDVSTGGILRPAINFGRNYLFSGTIMAEKNVEMMKLGQRYEVLIEMPTIEKAAYEAIADILHINGEFTIQLASRKIGKGKIVDYSYDE